LPHILACRVHEDVGSALYQNISDFDGKWHGLGKRRFLVEGRRFLLEGRSLLDGWVLITATAETTGEQITTANDANLTKAVLT
jgi:hypothetical protein